MGVTGTLRYQWKDILASGAVFSTHSLLGPTWFDLELRGGKEIYNLYDYHIIPDILPTAGPCWCSSRGGAFHSPPDSGTHHWKRGLQGLGPILSAQARDCHNCSHFSGRHEGRCPENGADHRGDGELISHCRGVQRNPAAVQQHGWRQCPPEDPVRPTGKPAWSFTVTFSSQGTKTFQSLESVPST